MGQSGYKEFGNWLREKRCSQKFDTRALEERSGVDHGTISRLENLRTQATLYTVVRLCEVFGVTAFALVSELRQDVTTSITLQKYPVTAKRSSMLLIDDIEKFGTICSQAQEAAERFLARLIGKAEKLLRPLHRPIEEQEQWPFRVNPHLLLSFTQASQLELTYPSEITSDQLLKILACGEIITLNDAGALVKVLRRERVLTLMKLEESAKISDSVLSRLETGSLQRIKLADILTIGETLGRPYEILAMYWQGCEFNSGYIRRRASIWQTENQRDSWTEQEFSRASFLIIMYRWIQYLAPNDITWLASLKDDLSKTYSAYQSSI